MRKKTYLFRRISALTLLLCMFLSACAAEEEVPVLLENNELSIPSITVEYGDVFNVDYATGGIHPHSEKLKFASAGTFAGFEVMSGQRVMQGDILAQLDTAALQAQLDSMKEDLDFFQDAAELELTTLNLAYQQIKEEQAQLIAAGAPEYELELKYIEAWEATMDIKHAKQNHELQFGKLEEQVRQLEETLTQDTKIIAPFDGTVTWVNSNLKKGSYLTEDMPVMAISSKDRLYVISNQVTDSYRTFCQRIYAKIGDQEFDLVMRERSMQEDMAQRRQQYNLTTEYDFVDELPAEIDTSGNALIVFLWNYRPNVLCLPNQTVYQGENGYYVYKIIDNEMVYTPVEIGVRSKQETEIISGLQEGDAVYAN